MNRFGHIQLGVMKHHIVQTAWKNAEGRTSDNVFLYTNTCSQSLLRQGVTLDSANSNANLCARLIHTYYGHGFNFYIEHSRV